MKVFNFFYVIIIKFYQEGCMDLKDINLLNGLTLLYVENDINIRQKTLFILHKLQINVIVATHGEDALEKFQNTKKIDIVMTDIQMPFMCGLSLIKALQNTSKNITIIATLNHDDMYKLHDIIDLGVCHYIFKPLIHTHITTILIKAVEPHILKNQLQKKHLELRQLCDSFEHRVRLRTRELEILATKDALTNLNNRRNFFKLITERFNSDKKTELYAVMMDLDNFKKINDTYGHHIGDKALTFIAKLINSMLNKDDILGRIGGEEFALLFSSTSWKKSIKKVEKIRKKIEKSPFSTDTLSIALSISNGIAKFEKDCTIDSVFARADKALYQAKREGKNRICTLEKTITRKD